MLRTGVALARKFGAQLHVLHIIHDPFNVNGWNLPVPSLDDEYKAMIAKAREKLDRIIRIEKAEGMLINEWVKDGDPVRSHLPQAVRLKEGVDLTPDAGPPGGASGTPFSSAIPTMPLFAGCRQA